MIYCVIPPELADELFDRLVEHYRNNENVEVIIDRRHADRRDRGEEVTEEIRNRRQIRDRRRSRPGSFPIIQAPEIGVEH